MKTCPKCSHTMDDTFTFCGRCGAPLPDGEPALGDEAEGTVSELLSESGEEEVVAPLPSFESADQEEEKDFESEPAPAFDSGFGAARRSPFEQARRSPFQQSSDSGMEEAFSFRNQDSDDMESGAGRSDRPNLPNLTSQPVQSMRTSRQPNSNKAGKTPPPRRARDLSSDDGAERRRSAFGAPGREEPARRPAEAVEEEEPFVPIPPFASHESQVESPFKSSAAFKSNPNAGKVDDSKPNPIERAAKASGPSHSIYDSSKTGYERTKPCPRCGALTYPQDQNCLTCGYRLVKIRRINIGAVIAALVLAVAVFLPYINALIGGTKKTLSLMGTTDGFILLALAAVVFVISILGRDVFIIALGVISGLYVFFLNQSRIYQICEDKWGEVIFKNDMSYYILYAAAGLILIMGIFGAINSAARNKQQMY